VVSLLCVGDMADVVLRLFFQSERSKDCSPPVQMTRVICAAKGETPRSGRGGFVL
jgi:hypothetical protein